MFNVRRSMFKVQDAALLFVMLGAFRIAVADWIQPPRVTESGYLVPQPDFEPQFPRDLGSHPGYAIEWWYWVGHLKSVEDGRTFGFQSTVFRIAGDPQAMENVEHRTSNAEHRILEDQGRSSQSSGQPVRPDPFGEQNMFMAHVALSDLSSGVYSHAERVFREGWQARASTETLDLQIGPIVANWNVAEGVIEKELALPEERMLQIKLKPLKPVVAFGERGLSRKGADPAAVSWYWTYPRLAITGFLLEGDRRAEVSGIGWMDHEISSSQLGSGLVGWDWTAIQLDDGTEVKAYRLRTSKGGADPWSAIYWIDASGKTTYVYAENFEWLNNKKWKSADSGNTYPSDVIIRALHPETGDEKVYRLQPLLDAQEFVGNRKDNAYWEGACAVFDENNQQIGKAYLELVGYGGSMADQLRR